MSKSVRRTQICIEGRTWHAEKSRLKTFRLLNQVLGEAEPNGRFPLRLLKQARISSSYAPEVPEIMSFLAHLANLHSRDIGYETAFWVCAIAATTGLQFSAIKGIRMDMFRFGKTGELEGYLSPSGCIFSGFRMNSSLTRIGFDDFVDCRNDEGDEFLFQALHDSDVDVIRFKRQIATLVQRHLRFTGVSARPFSIQYLNESYWREVASAVARRYVDMNPDYANMSVTPAMRLIGGMWKMLSEIPYMALSGIDRAPTDSAVMFSIKEKTPWADAQEQNKPQFFQPTFAAVQMVESF